MTRELGAGGTPPRALVRFAPEAKMADINAPLDTIRPPPSAAPTGRSACSRQQVDGKDEVAGLMSKLRGEKIVSPPNPAP